MGEIVSHRDRPRVFFLTHHLPWPTCSGGRLREAELLSRLAPHFAIELIAISKVPDTDLPHVNEASRRGIKVRIFPALASNTGDSSPHVRQHQSAAARSYLSHRLAQDDDAVVHVEGHYLLHLLPMHTRHRAFIVEHNVESILFEQRALLGPDPVKRHNLLGSADTTRRVERDAWRAARMVGTVTDEDARLIKEAAPEVRVKVIPDGADHLINTSIPAEQPKESEGRLLFVANFAYQPNEDAAHVLITEIFPEILKHCPRATLALVGAAPPPWLHNAVRNEPRISITGWVSDVGAWLDAADVVVCPLRIGGGVKVKILEALSRGRAVVTTPIGLQGLRHLPAGAAVECRDPASVVDACVTLLTSPEERRRQQLRAGAAVNRLPTWDQAADMLASVWTELADTGPRPIAVFAEP